MMIHLRSAASFCVLLAIALGPIGAARAGGAEKTQPNFLIMLADDLGYGDLSCYGHPVIQTPNLDRLAAQGIRLTDCYSSAPVCSPSRAGLLTGRAPSRLGVYDWIPGNSPVHLKREEVTFATALNRAGYATCFTGKWHLNGKFNSDEQPQPGDHGFDYWFGTQNNARPSHENPVNFARNGRSVGKLEGFASAIVADEAIEWMRGKRDPSKPFLLYVAFHEPHEPVASPPELVAQYRDQAKNEDQAQYFANVTNMDRAVGRLMAALDEMDLAENTLVFFTSDNGPETLNRYRSANRSYGSPGPLRGMKLHLYEGGIRVPGILRFPGRIEPGQVTSEPVCGLDVLPTLCELAGIEPPSGRKLDGASFVSIFEGQPIQRTQPLYWHYYRSIGQPKAAMRSGPWMVLGHWDGGSEFSPGGGVHRGDADVIKSARLTEFELYNLDEDLGETADVAGQNPDRLAELSGAIKAIYRDVQDEGPVWEFPDP